MRRISFWWWSGLLFLALSFDAPGLLGSAQAIQAPSSTKTPRGVKLLSATDGVDAFELKNGLKVLLIPDLTKTNFLLQVVVHVGSAHEGYGERGMAHLLEHLLFKGTPKHPGLVKELKAQGAQYNATTFVDRTQYYESMSYSGAGLRWALEMEADRLIHANLKRTDLDSEMSVVRNEFENSENQGPTATVLRTFSTAFLWHNNGNPTIGVRSDIENVDIERLRAFYSLYYQPDNATLILSGNMESAEKALSLVEQTFGKIPKPKRVLPKVYTVEPPQEGERRVTVAKPGASRVWVGAYHVPPSGHIDEPALDVLVSLLTDTPSGFLHEDLVKPGIANSVQAQVMTFKDPGLFLIFVEAAQGRSLLELESIVDQRLLQLRQNAEGLITEAAVTRQRDRLLRAIEQSISDSHALALGLVDSVSLGDYRIFFQQKQELAKVNAQRVREVFLRYFKNTNRTVGLFEPTEKPELVVVPGSVDIPLRLKEFVAKESAQKGESVGSTPEAIEKRITRLELRPGLKLAMLSKKTRGQVVRVKGDFRIGNVEWLKGKRGLGQMAGRLYQRAAKDLSEDQIKELLSSAHAQLLLNGGPESAHFSLQTTRENLAKALEITFKLFKEAEFPKSEFEQERANWISELRNLQTDPGGASSLWLGRVMHPYPEGDVRATQDVPAKIKEIEALQADQVTAYYSEVVGADLATLAVVGDFDEAAVRRQIEASLGEWHSKVKAERVGETYFDVMAGVDELRMPGRQGAVVLGALNLPLREDHADAVALEVAVRILGGSTMHSRLAERLRQKEGLSYGVHAALRLSDFDSVGSFSVSATFAPQSKAKMEKALRDVFVEAEENGFTAKELALEVDAMAKEMDQSFGDDATLLGFLTHGLESGKKLAYFSNRLAEARRLRVDEVNRAFRKWIGFRKMRWVWAGSF